MSDGDGLRAAVPPEDDDPAVVNRAIGMLRRRKRYRAKLLLVGNAQGYEASSTVFLRVISFSYWMNEVMWRMESGEGTRVRIEDCINMIRKVSKRNPEELMNLLSEAHQLGIAYRRLRQRIRS